MTEKYLADTYAYIEILKDNPNYHAFRHKALLTTEHVITELVHWHIRRDEPKQGMEIASRLWNEKISPTLLTILKAMRLKHERRKDKLSYTDCIGYALAAELGMRFLTGDEKFEMMPNVEFVR